MRAWICLS
jgi:hypothetical protein